MERKNKFYVTTPIYYVTARPHLGTLYTTVLADVVARWNKLKGKKVFFLTGTDEHGQKIAQAAEKVGKTPQEFTDSFIHIYKDIWHKYAIEYDHFIRTTDTQHVKAVQDWLAKLLKQGDIYKSFYKGWYCVSCEAFAAEQLDHHEAPVCPDCNRLTTEVAEESYFFRLSAYQDKLLQFYQDNPDFIVPRERANEVINFVKSGLRDLSISRTSISWGIAFPGDNNHVTYVWADALSNYITAIGYCQQAKQEDFKFWWPADLHILGKDIIRFHAVYWPAFLMASDLDLPKQLLVHGWIRMNKEKMSKSFGNIVDPQALYDAYGPEPVRYYLLKQIAVNQDGEFNIDDLQERISSDLANDLGNLLNRMVSLAQRHELFEVVPPVAWSEDVVALRDECLSMVEDFQNYMDDYVFHLALARLWKFINKVNAYFHKQEPWKIVKHDKEKFAEIISATSHSLYAIAVVLWPIMPHKMESLLHSLSAPLNLENDTIENLELSVWSRRFMLKKIKTLFEKAASSDQKAETESVAAPSKKNEHTYIAIDDVAKIKLVVGTIEGAEEIEGSQKLLKLRVNLGQYGTRQILAGVKKFYSPDQLAGQQGVFIVNLKPRKMMGLESQGMMLFAESDDKSLKFVTLSGTVPNGAELR